ncbi:MAG: aminopeptidase N, partial [Pseudomonadota bacterium]
MDAPTNGQQSFDRPQVWLKDYQPYPFSVSETKIEFKLDPVATTVSSKLVIKRLDEKARSIWLDGEELDLKSIAINGQPVAQYAMRHEPGGLWLDDVPDSFVLEIVTQINPSANTRLEGLYYTEGLFCTQCEANGFRRITFYPDRPDLMSLWHVSIEADARESPALLSNGNPGEALKTEDGRHRISWHDPYPKPAYLFALVAGDLACLPGQFTTMEGRTVKLAIYTEHGEAGRAHHAMQCLKDAMKWDEQRFGLACDLDHYSIVATAHFNMGAMENKGLNIFNSRYVLVDHETATDREFSDVHSVIGHEYFHNWTGNRVTLRDWFQLSLKEGLTVFRDQEFTSDSESRAVKRIEDVRFLREVQFSEDRGPLRAPVRPQSYREINNFYTATVYEKGAEIIRMIHRITGEEGFIRGHRRYIREHDGKAAICEDLFAAMAQENPNLPADLFRWYDIVGTPELHVHDHFDHGRYSLELSVQDPAHEQLVIPIACRLFDLDGTVLPVTPVEGDWVCGDDRETILLWHRASMRFVVDGLRQKPVATLGRGCSAPIILHHKRPPSPQFVLRHEQDAFMRWDAADGALYGMAEKLATAQACHLDDEALALLDRIIELGLDAAEDPAWRAQILTWPDAVRLFEQMNKPDPDRIAQAVDYLHQTAATRHQSAMRQAFELLGNPDGYDAKARGERALLRALIKFVRLWPDGGQILGQLYDRAATMTVRLAALAGLCQIDGET